MLLIFATLAALYLFSAPRTVVLEDDGLFILSSYFLGIEHPPGYPLFVLLGKLATLVPLGNVAWRVHALSGLFAAGACVLLFRSARQLLPGRPAALLAGLGLGVSVTFWSQAIIADVYSLHCLIVCALLTLALASNPPGAPRPGPADPLTGLRLAGSALLFGLGLANHWPLLVLCVPALGLLWLPAWRAILRRLPVLLALVAVGLLPYVWMILRSLQDPVISFQGPMADAHTIIDFLLRRGYASIDHSSTAGWMDRLGFGADLLQQAGAQLLLPGALLALLGALGQWRAFGWRIALALTLAFLGPMVVVLVLLGFDHQDLQRDAVRVYLLVAWAVLALWAGLGLCMLEDRLRAHWPLLHTRPAARWLAPIAVVALLALTLAWHWPQNDRHQDWLARAYGETLLALPPVGALFLVREDMPTTTTSYLHLIEGQRPDLLLVSETALVLTPKPFNPRYTDYAHQPAAVAAFVAAEGRPVFRLNNHDLSAGNTWLGAYQDPNASSDKNLRVFELPPPERALLQRIAAASPLSDGWSENLRRKLMTRFVYFLAHAEMAGDALATEPALRAIADEAIRQQPEAALARAQVLALSDPKAHAAEVHRLLERFVAGITDPALTKRERAEAYNLLANEHLRAGNRAGYRQAVQASLTEWPSSANPAQAVAAAAAVSGESEPGPGSSGRKPVPVIRE